MFCAQKAVNSASALPTSLGKLAFLTHRILLPFTVCMGKAEKSGAGTSPAEFHRCSRDRGLVKWHPGHGSARPEVGRGCKVWHGRLCLQVCWAQWITGQRPGAVPESSVTRSTERDNRRARMKESSLRLWNKVGGWGASEANPSECQTARHRGDKKWGVSADKRQLEQVTGGRTPVGIRCCWCSGILPGVVSHAPESLEIGAGPLPPSHPQTNFAFTHTWRNTEVPFP